LLFPQMYEYIHEINVPLSDNPTFHLPHHRT
jgi:hypothetical protein